MTTGDVLLALATRCQHERATIELDREIAAAAGWRRLKVRRGHAQWRSPAGEAHYGCPSYTNSIDDAAEIVPKGYAWVLEVAPRQRAATVYPSMLMERKWSCFAKTPALALCGAALLARGRVLIEKGLPK